MALYIVIRKTMDHPASAEYAFGTSEDRLGQFKIDKATSDVVLVEPAPGDDEGALYQRAMYKVKKHWATGELPDVTCWAS
jgi:hypothetical protein